MVKTTVGKLMGKSKGKEIECVVVGDAGVGKTKLICSYIYEFPAMDIDKLNSWRHIPSVFAWDTYDTKTAKHLQFDVGKRSVNLKIWDTFGDHAKNRQYCYKNADAVIICFSVGQISSLESVISKWYPEVMYYCPKAPIILVGTQHDRRHNDHAKYVTHSKRVKTLREYLQPKLETKFAKCENVESQYGRIIASKINAQLYLECSVATKYGVGLVFHSIAQVAILKELNNNDKLNLLQRPYLPLKVISPEVNIPKLDISKAMFNHIYSPSTETNLNDVVFIVHHEKLYAHCTVLSLASSLFKQLFSQLLNLFDTTTDLELCSRYVNENILVNNEIECSIPRGFTNISVNVSDLSYTMEIIGVSILDFTCILEFYYTGEIGNIQNPSRLLRACSYLQLNLAFEYVFNFINEQYHWCVEIKQQLCRTYSENRKLLWNNMSNCDVNFVIDATMVPVHKVIITQWCSIFRAMFQNRFIECQRSKVNKVLLFE